MWNLIGKIQSKLSVKIYMLLILLIILPLYLIFFSMTSMLEDYFKTELNNKTANTFYNSEADIYNTFNSIANLSNLICLNESLQTALSSDTSYYERTLVFDRVIGDISFNNLYNMQNAQITIIDNNHNIYSNWSQNFNDYSFLYEQQWVKDSLAYNGHIIWSILYDPYIKEDHPSEKYIGLARTIWVDDKNDNLGIVLISVRQSEISKILEKYRFSENDYIIVCDEDNQTVLSLGPDSSVMPETLASISKQYAEQAQPIIKLNDRQYLLCSYKITKRWIVGQRTLSILYFSDYQSVTRQMNVVKTQINLIAVFSIVVMLVILMFISVGIVRPLKRLSEEMEQYPLEPPANQLNVKRRDEIGSLNRAFLDMRNRIHQLFEQLEKEHYVKEQYKLDFLKAQLNPHFLFNTLSTIRWMAIVSQAGNIVESIDALGNMLKYSMRKGEELVTLEDELQNLKSYIKIQNYRYGKQYAIEDLVADELRYCKIIRFILQPVIENSLLHAFKDMSGKGKICITAHIKADILLIEIVDNGKGIDKQKLDSINSYISGNDYYDDSGSQRFNKIGIHNIKQQIAIRYGSDYSLTYESDGINGTRVTYRLPVIKEEGAAVEKSNGS